MKITESVIPSKGELIKDDFEEIFDPQKLEQKPDAVEDKENHSILLNQDPIISTWRNQLANNSDSVSILEAGEFIYAGNQSTIYKITKLGSVASKAVIGNNGKEIRLALHPRHLIVGSNGKIIVIPLASISDSKSHITISLKDADDIVSVVVDGNTIFAGSNGKAYKISNWEGKSGDTCTIDINNLPGKKFREVRLSLTSQYLVVGTYGFVVLINKTTDFDKGNKNIDISLPSCGYETVSVRVNGSAIYAGSNGYVYKITQYGQKDQKIEKNSLTGRGNNPVEIDFTTDKLVVGINGFLVLVKLGDFENDQSTTHYSLPDCGYTKVSVKGVGNKSYAASNGYIYYDVGGSDYTKGIFTKNLVNFDSDEDGNLYFASDGTVYGRSVRRELPVKLIGQKTSQWCWAATAEMIMDYHKVPVDQCRQANDLLNRTDCCFIPTPQACIEPGHSNFQLYGFQADRKPNKAYLTFQEIISQIESNLPFAFSWAWNDGGGHQMNIVGYSTDFKMVLVLDPWPEKKGERRWIAYSSYIENWNYTHNYDIINIKPKNKIMNSMEFASGENIREEHTFTTSKEAVITALNTFTQLESQEPSVVGFGIPLQFISLNEVRNSQEPSEIFNKTSDITQVLYPIFNKQDGRLVSCIVIKRAENGWKIDSIGGTSLVDGLTIRSLEGLKLKNTRIKLVSVPSIYHHVLIEESDGQFKGIFHNVDLAQRPKNKWKDNLNHSIEDIWREMKLKANYSTFE